MILAKLLTNVRGAEIGQLADQVDGNLTGFVDTLGLLRTSQNGLVHGVELTNLADDQTRCGQRVAFILEHIVNGTAHIGQIQGHIVQISIGHDLLDRAFNLTYIVGHIHCDIVTNIIG